MKSVCTLVALVLLACGLSSCKMTDEQYAVRQKIPVEIQSGTPLVVKIKSLSGNGLNDVGIQCTPDVWQTLTNGYKKTIEVRLLRTSAPGTEIGDISPGSGAHYFLGMVTNTHYLFYVSGKYRSSATVEIRFPKAPSNITHARIMVGKTAADTGL